MEEQEEIVNLVKELVHRLLNQTPNPNNNPLDFQNFFRYAVRILSSRLTPSIAPDASAMAESIKRSLATRGKSSEALTFADLYNKLDSRSGPGSITNKWSVLHLLKIVSDDRKIVNNACHAGIPLPNLPINDSESSKSSWGFRNLGGRDTNWNNGVLVVKKDPENLREIAFIEFRELVKEENEVLEEVLVRDVLYACQGIDGKYVKFDAQADGYNLLDTVKVSRASRVVVKKLCVLGWLFNKVKGYISANMGRHGGGDDDDDDGGGCGTVMQAFCAALQDELSEYYKLLAVLEAQAMNPIPLVSDAASSRNYLSLRRLMVWLAEPMLKMRFMEGLIDKCRVLKGGAMAGAIHLHAQHGDPLVHQFMRSLLRRVCSPLFEMVRRWVLEGELEDMFSEFFIVSHAVKAESLWREGYRLHTMMLPSFIPLSLAHRILRAGKSINFLRVCCDDHGWANATAEAAAAAGTTTRRGSLGYGETDALETLVVEAVKRIDKHLLDVIYTQYKFKDHCLAMKRYLLLGQGDFVQYLMDIVGSELSEPANTISSFKLAGFLESSIRSSNAQYDDAEILDRLRVSMMVHEPGDRGWDVFSLEYDARVPLDTIFTESVLEKYLRIFNFLWKLRRVEHSLIGAWKTMKPNCISAHSFMNIELALVFRLRSMLRRCQVLWVEMNHFVTNLQYYIMFEVLEVSWSHFLTDMEIAKDLDDLLVAHDKYLHSIILKSLLGDLSHPLRTSLLVLFDLIIRFKSHVGRLYKGIHELQSRSKASSSLSSEDKNKLHKETNMYSEPGSWINQGRKALTKRAAEFLGFTKQEIDATATEYTQLLEEFVSQLSAQKHVDLKFLLFRLNFTQFYGHPRSSPSVGG